MCGIFGVVHFGQEPIQEDWLRAMGKTIQHRGPDDSGLYLSSKDNVALGHQRLAIIDLSEDGRQPMVNETGDVVMIFNGEVYNFNALRHQLLNRGHQFQSRTDAEVVLHGYEDEGVDFIHRLDGMFSFVIWDKRDGQLLLVRDRNGKKPLFYFSTREAFVFASELKAILKYPKFKSTLNSNALKDYLTFGYIPSPHCLLQGVEKVPAGHVVKVNKLGGVDVEQYWDVTLGNPSHVSQKECARTIRQLVSEAVEKRLVSDVPIGALLSGGVDSTIVTGLASRKLGKELKTFSVGFQAGERTQKVNWDLRTACRTANRFGTDHYDIIIDNRNSDFSTLIDEMVWHLDEPMANPTVISTLVLSKLVRQHGVKVVMTGDGGDEIFMGYDRYSFDRYIRFMQILPERMRMSLMAALGAFPQEEAYIKKGIRALQKSKTLPKEISGRYLGWRQIFSEREIALLMGDFHDKVDNFPNYNPSDHVNKIMHRYPKASSEDRLSYADLRLWLADENNMRIDKMLMSSSIEGRVPLEDQKLVEYSMGLPRKFKQRFGQTKFVLRQAFPDLLDDSSFQEKKRGFFSPAKWWLENYAGDYMNNLLTKHEVERIGILDWEGVKSLKNDDGWRRKSGKLWAVMILQRWGQLFLCDH